MAMKALLVLFVLASTLTSIKGLLCYSCVSIVGSDWRCLIDPDGASIYPFVECAQGSFCLIQRIENKQNQVLMSILRQCSTDAAHKNRTYTEGASGAQVLVHYTACDFEKCNSGVGEPVWGSGSGSGGSNINGPAVMHVPGRGMRSAAPAPSATAPMLATLLAACLAAALR